MRPISLFFRMANIQVEELLSFIAPILSSSPQIRPRTLWTWTVTIPMLRPLGFFDLVREAKEKGEYPKECHYLRLDNLNLAEGIVTVNTTRVYDVDGTSAEDLTKAYTKGERIGRQNHPLPAEVRPRLLSTPIFSTKLPCWGSRDAEGIAGRLRADRGGYR